MLTFIITTSDRSFPVRLVINGGKQEIVEHHGVIIKTNIS